MLLSHCALSYRWVVVVKLLKPFFQAWREEGSLAQYRTKDVADVEAATLDVASGVPGRTRLDTVKAGLKREMMKSMGLQ